ncbi:DUF3606 domain-containing protein [Brevundimonas sp.]|uniref:DUF3606 domain-containing protein n=1 Tax=Brevundimonas sp. TaxID=1871086 RepID=UPI002D588F41|nr:DUF3606 domain-containing protein [Brevundimonas sp.]HYD28067.1 DUF3606 domain-containing protein [Brevundimonas sp.]
MSAISETGTPPGLDWSPVLGSGLPPDALGEADVLRLAETFAVTPEAVRLAVARVGTSFRDVQRELGGRR